MTAVPQVRDSLPANGGALGPPALDAAALEAGLQRLGYERFRPGQQESIETLLRVRRLLLVAPTGGGKSLVYQLPASILPGTSLVVSPLIALMDDQVRALEQRGIAATFIASTLDAAETRRRMARMAEGAYKLVYVAPERLAFPGFRGILRELAPPLVAIDEAHCISEWGHDFRPDYMAIGGLLAELPTPCVLACTATATPVVRDEIVARLGLGADTPQIVRGFARPNLVLRARELDSRRARDRAVDAQLAEALGRPGGRRGTAIVYAPTRRSTDAEAARLSVQGWRAHAYHAGLHPHDREAVHKAFAGDQAEIVVATNAFGMGIDRADVRAVVHLAPPGSIEAYYQEVGRAGRDGADAFGLMLVSPGDMSLRRQILEAPVDGRAPNPAAVEHKWGLFLELMRWAHGGSCRHDAILRYFGDEAETLDGCGRCDVCKALGSVRRDDDPEETTLMVRKALSGVARVSGQFGIKAAVKLLRGEKDPRLERAGLDKVSTMGVLKEHSEEWILALLNRCVVAGWIDFQGAERPVVVLSAEGRAVMKAERPARVLLPPRGPAGVGSRMAPPEPRRRSGAAGPAAAGVEGLDLDPHALRVFEALRSHRLEVAQRERVPPYVVASDRTLRDLALLRPVTIDQLLLAHGIGPAKADRYGAGFLEVIRAQTQA